MTNEIIKRVIYKKGDHLYLEAGVRYEIVVDMWDDERKAGEWYTIDFNAEAEKTYTNAEDLQARLDVLKTEKLKPAEWIENVLYAYGQVGGRRNPDQSVTIPAVDWSNLTDSLNAPVDWSDK